MFCQGQCLAAIEKLNSIHIKRMVYSLLIAEDLLRGLKAEQVGRVRLKFENMSETWVNRRRSNPA